MNEIIEQYKELCNSGRDIDNKLWSIPTASFTMEAFAVQGYLTYSSPNVRLLISLLAFLMFTGLWFLYIRFRGYQINVQKSIDELVKNNLPGFMQVHQFTNLSELPKNTFWMIKCIKFSSSNYIIIVMFITVITNFVLLIKSVLNFLFILN